MGSSVDKPNIELMCMCDENATGTYLFVFFDLSQIRALECSTVSATSAVARLTTVHGVLDHLCCKRLGSNDDQHKKGAYTYQLGVVPISDVTAVSCFFNRFSTPVGPVATNQWL